MLTPVDCATHGWVAFTSANRPEMKMGQQEAGGGTIRCVTCSKIKVILIPIPDITKMYEEHEDSDPVSGYSCAYTNQVAVAKKLILRIKRELVEDHSESCPWRKRKSSLDLESPYYLRLAGVPSISVMTDYEKRLSNLATVFDQKESSGQLTEKTKIYAAMGWSPLSIQGKYSSPNSHILECDACFRRIVAKAPTVEENSDDIEEWTKALVEQHCSYCAYLHVYRSGNTKVDKEMGYEKILKAGPSFSKNSRFSDSKLILQNIEKSVAMLSRPNDEYPEDEDADEILREARVRTQRLAKIREMYRHV